MREFSYEDKLFIMRHQDDWTLRELALKFKCYWKDVFRAYEEVMKTEDFKKFTTDRREKMHRTRRKKYGSNREENNGSEENLNYGFLNKSYTISGFRTTGSIRCNMYWK